MIYVTKDSKREEYCLIGIVSNPEKKGVVSNKI